MREAPTGRYVVKYGNKPLAARTYHLYKDCGYMQGLMSEGLDPVVMEPSDEIVSILEMRVCSGCEDRSNLVPAVDVIADVVGGSNIAGDVLAALAANNYEVIRIKKRRTSATTDTDKE